MPVSTQTQSANWHLARMAKDAERRSQERATSYNANPAAYLAKRAALGWPNDVPRGCEPPKPSPADLDMSQLPGYRVHLSIDAITDAILELRAEKQRAARHNQDERETIKAAFGPTFADVGLRLVCIPRWNRHERTILNPRLA